MLDCQYAFWMGDLNYRMALPDDKARAPCTGRPRSPPRMRRTCTWHSMQIAPCFWLTVMSHQRTDEDSCQPQACIVKSSA